MDKDAASVIEELKPLGKLVAERIGRRLSPATVWRWHSKGLANGARLRVARIGKGLFCCPRWLDEFILAQNPGQPIAAPPAVENPSEAQLREAGLLPAAPR
jgi:hypothetical protein